MGEGKRGCSDWTRKVNVRSSDHSGERGQRETLLFIEMVPTFSTRANAGFVLSAQATSLEFQCALFGSSMEIARLLAGCTLRVVRVLTPCFQVQCVVVIGSSRLLRYHLHSRPQGDP